RQCIKTCNQFIDAFSLNENATWGGRIYGFGPPGVARRSKGYDFCGVALLPRLRFCLIDDGVVGYSGKPTHETAWRTVSECRDVLRGIEKHFLQNVIYFKTLSHGFT